MKRLVFMFFIFISCKQEQRGIYFSNQRDTTYLRVIECNNDYALVKNLKTNKNEKRFFSISDSEFYKLFYKVGDTITEIKEKE